jgi:hypothetical protein
MRLALIFLGTLAIIVNANDPVLVCRNDSGKEFSL